MPKEDWWEKHLKKQQEEASYALMKIKADLMILRDKFKFKNHIIEAEYSGSGDCGDINGFSIVPRNHECNNICKWNAHTLTEFLKEEFNYEDSVRVRRENRLNNIFENLQENIYSILTYDWYNNEGGQGTVKLDIDNLKIDIDGSYNVQHEFDCSEAGQITSFNLNESV